MRKEILIFPDLESLSEKALELFVKIGRESIRKKGVFTVAFSGGKTPVRLYELIGKKCRKALNWNRVQIFQADERAVPPNHRESNFRLLSEGFLSKIKIPPANVHRIAAEQKELDRAARDYEGEIRAAFRVKNAIPRFDLIFLGVGKDGHTASLFAGSPAMKEKKHMVVKNFYKKLGFWRVTMTRSFLNQALNIIFMADGEEKQEIVGKILMRKRNPYPAGKICPGHGNLTWLMTESCAGQTLF